MCSLDWKRVLERLMLEPRCVLKKRLPLVRLPSVRRGLEIFLKQWKECLQDKTTPKPPSCERKILEVFSTPRKPQHVMYLCLCTCVCRLKSKSASVQLNRAGGKCRNHRLSPPYMHFHCLEDTQEDTWRQCLVIVPGLPSPLFHFTRGLFHAFFLSLYLFFILIFSQ